MAKQTTRKRDLPKPERGRTMAGADDGVAAPNTKDLAKRLNQDRLKRKMTWPRYADFLGVKLSTVYKIAKGATTRPHELTVAQIEDKLAEPTAEGAADAVVSSGQRHPERSEN